MSLYLDASALVKRYVEEWGSDVVAEGAADDGLHCTSTVTRAEVAAALSRAIRVGALEGPEAEDALHLFRGEWTRMARVHATEAVIGMADEVGWEHALRGYDAVQLASVLWWRNAVDPAVTFATFDRRLWEVASERDLSCLPADLPALLDSH